MKNKGFTLAELLGVILIISFILMIVMLPMTKHIKEGTENIKEAQLKIIQLGTENWISDNIHNMPQKDGETITITVGTLKQEGFLEMDIKDPTTGECIPNNTEVTITRVNGKYEISIDLDSGTDECTAVDNAGPIIYLNGTTLEYVEFGTTWNDLGATAKTSRGVPITNITTKVTKNGPTVDTSRFGEYEVTYSVKDNGITATVKRTIVIVDTTAPTLTVPATSVISSDVTSINLMTGVSATDLADGNVTSRVIVTGGVTPGALGEYIIKYTVTDNAGNTATAYRKIIIRDQTKPTSSATVVGSPFNANGWSKANFDVKIQVADQGGSGPLGFKVCQDTAGTCTPTTRYDQVVKSFTISNQSASNYICVIPYDNAGNEGSKQCYGPYKLDRDKPTVTATDITLTQFDSYDIWGSFSATDNLTPAAQLTKTYDRTPDPNTPGTYTVTYSVTDLAGNTKTVTRNYIVNPKMYTVDVNPVINGTVYGSGYSDFTFSVYRSDTNTWTENVTDWCQSVPHGTRVIVRANAHTGYTYNGGDYDGVITSAQDIRPSWSVNSYTVTYKNPDGTTYSTRSVNYGSAPESLGYSVDDFHYFHGWTGLPGSMPAYDVSVTANVTHAYCKLITGHAAYGNAEALLRVFNNAGWSGEIKKTAGYDNYYHVETDYSLTREQTEQRREYLQAHTNYSNSNYPFLRWLAVSCDNGYLMHWSRDYSTYEFHNEW